MLSMCSPSDHFSFTIISQAFPSGAKATNIFSVLALAANICILTAHLLLWYVSLLPHWARYRNPGLHQLLLSHLFPNCDRALGIQLRWNRTRALQSPSEGGFEQLAIGELQSVSPQSASILLASQSAQTSRFPRLFPVKHVRLYSRPRATQRAVPPCPCLRLCTWVHSDSISVRSGILHRHNTLCWCLYVSALPALRIPDASGSAPLQRAVCYLVSAWFKLLPAISIKAISISSLFPLIRAANLGCCPSFGHDYVI